MIALANKQQIKRLEKLMAEYKATDPPQEAFVFYD
jgi:hypothetical protein